MWLAIKDLYTEVRGQVLYSSTLFRKFDISQGTGQGRILAPFMYKVYINPSFTKGGGEVEPTPKGFSSITFEQNKLETSNFS